ncbi:DUF2497 domain-containing protein [Sphingomonas sp. SUN019]|uniref:DUF2497 domain-containing protein n=1 Tax=Sphingomonas sp. SUN019 TaxID=2937788 RepID=UPI002164A80C|nr:DUF2497 domain-containing protein [Sphingomonas sp. SUN019]UVO49107.1 DUF2497 domain-containing protein [Sphingomonas sp. SUN019]
MADTSAEPSMEDILSSIKRIIAEEGEGAAPRTRRGPIRAMPTPPSAEQDEVLELSDPIEPATADPVPTRPAVAARPTILSDTTAQATRGALDALSRLVVKPEPGADDTLEGLVREMLRPMLRDWLDANLPAMVETLVAKEITRITHETR